MSASHCLLHGITSLRLVLLVFAYLHQQVSCTALWWRPLMSPPMSDPPLAPPQNLLNVAPFEKPFAWKTYG